MRWSGESVLVVVCDPEYGFGKPVGVRHPDGAVQDDVVGRQLNGIARYDSSWRSASEIAVPSLLAVPEVDERAREDGGRRGDPDREDRERDQQLDQPDSLLRPQRAPPARARS